jgi:uncharacterized protein YutE (UPF0331/DUF86 family)
VTHDIDNVLAENLASMQKSITWLKRSYSKCSRIGIKESYSEDEFDDFENLVGRYARTIDVIVNKVFRSIDAVELEDGGTMIDVVNRAEKRGIVQSADRVRDLKSLRNDIVHEYETDDLRSLFRQTLDSVPELFTITEKVRAYCARFDLPSVS